MTDKTQPYQEKDPKDCYDVLCQNSGALLIDCRTKQEWDLTGVADLSACQKKPLFVEWTDAQNQSNQAFLAQVQSYASPETMIIVMCRIGGRSADACQFLAEHGYENLINMTEGFEGRADENGHRNSYEGWRAHGLPWIQS